MFRFLPLLCVFYYLPFIRAEIQTNGATCGGFQANFDMKNVIGPWYVVAIIPENLFPDKQVTCYKVEFSETDEAGLRWLVNKTLESSKKLSLAGRIKGTIVRQRYHSEDPFDLWSQSIPNVSGCFQQVLSLELDKSDINKTVTQDAMMQLHLMDAANGSEPFLLQMLWGKLISVVIYRRNQGVTQEELKPVFELMNKLRGPQRIPRICDNPLKDLNVLKQY